MITENKESINLPAIPRQGWRCFRSEAELEQVCIDYIKYEEARDMPVLVIGLAVFCNIGSTTMCEYAKGTYDDALNRYSEVLRRFKDRVEYDKTGNALIGKYQANFAKFDLMNNHNWAEKKAVEGTMTHKGTVEVKKAEEYTSDEEINRNYQDLLRASQDRLKEPVK